MRRIVVVGGSLAGVRAAEALRGAGFGGELAVVDADARLPYERYPLSKDFLTGDRELGDIEISTHGIDATWVRPRRAVGLDLHRQRLRLDDGDDLPFDGLVVASGARSRTLRAQDMALDGVLAVRTLDDALSLRAALRRRPDQVVVLGGGLIGSEIASVARSLGLSTTVVDGNDLPLSRTFGSQLAAWVAQLHERSGVRMRRGSRVETLVGSSGSVIAVQLADGQRVPADLVVVALGVTPETEWLHGSGLQLNDGVVCDRGLFAVGSANVVAAGDVARWPHPLFGGRRYRVEHWSIAAEQGAVAARNLLHGPARATAFTGLPNFGTHLHRAAIRAVGFPQFAAESRVIWGSLAAERCLIGYYGRDRLIGVVALNARERVAEWQPLLQRHQSESVRQPAEATRSGAPSRRCSAW